MLEMHAFGVSKSKLPNRVLCPTCFLVYIAAGLPELKVRKRQELSHGLKREKPVWCCCVSTGVCVLHDHDMGTNVWLPNMHNTPPDADLESLRFMANQRLEIRLVCTRLLLWSTRQDECS